MPRPPRPFSAILLHPLRLLLLALLVAPLAPSAVVVGAAPADASTRLSARSATYYLDPAGSDAAAGTSPRAAWSSLARVGRAPLQPGDRVLLRRGASWTGALRIAASGTGSLPIRIGTYGTGAAPRVTGDCVEVTGDDVVVEGLAVHHCTWWGVHVLGDRVTVRGVLATRNVAGISVDRGADDARVLNNTLLDNDRLAPGTDGADDDYGANGIEVLGDRAEIGGNTITGSHAPSADYGQDGSAVEVYEAEGTWVHDNVARDNLTFTELGSALTADTLYERNVVRSSVADSSFLITRGPGDAWGPVFGTVAKGNDVRLTGAGSFLTWCGGTCGPDVLLMQDNVLSLG